MDFLYNYSGLLQGEDEESSEDECDFSFTGFNFGGRGPFFGGRGFSYFDGRGGTYFGSSFGSSFGTSFGTSFDLG